MDSPFSPKDDIWFLRMCHHISNAVFKSVYRTSTTLALCICWSEYKIMKKVNKYILHLLDKSFIICKIHGTFCIKFSKNILYRTVSALSGHMSNCVKSCLRHRPMTALRTFPLIARWSFHLVYPPCVSQFLTIYWSHLPTLIDLQNH